MDMPDQPITFCYFADPHNFSTYTNDLHQCDICHQERPAYEWPFYGNADQLKFVCEQCIAGGRLAEFDATTNSAEPGGLAEVVRIVHPEWTPDEQQQYVAERTKELEERTPHIVTWQDSDWPIHCDDYMRYLKGAGRLDCEKPSVTGDAEAFFKQHLADQNRLGDTDAAIQEYVNNLWGVMRVDCPQNGENTWGTEFYLYQCTRCGEYSITWDCD